MNEGGARIALLLPSLAGGGAERITLALAREFVREGYRVDVVLAQAKGELVDEVVAGAKVVDLKAKRLRYVLWPLRKYLRHEQPDVLLAAMWPLTGLAIVASRLAGTKVPVIVSEHNTYSQNPVNEGLAGQRLRFGLRWLLPRARAVVAVSHGVADDLVKLGLRGIAPTVIYNPVQAPKAETRLPPDLSNWWGQGGAVKLLAVGSFKPQKDFPMLLKALSELSQVRQARLIILGEGPLRDDLERLIREYGLSDHVRLPGFIVETGAYFKMADIFVLSSAWEGLPTVLIEALACGTAVVSTACPSGPDEILSGGQYGELVPVGDEAGLAKAIERTVADMPDRQILERRAMEFSPAVAVEKYLDVLFPDRS